MVWSWQRAHFLFIPSFYCCVLENSDSPLRSSPLISTLSLFSLSIVFLFRSHLPLYARASLYFVAMRASCLWMCVYASVFVKCKKGRQTKIPKQNTKLKRIMDKLVGQCAICVHHLKICCCLWPNLVCVYYPNSNMDIVQGFGEVYVREVAVVRHRKQTTWSWRKSKSKSQGSGSFGESLCVADTAILPHSAAILT